MSLQLNKRFRVQFLHILKIDWCFDLIIKNGRIRLKKKKNKKKNKNSSPYLSFSILLCIIINNIYFQTHNNSNAFPSVPVRQSYCRYQSFVNRRLFYNSEILRLLKNRSLGIVIQFTLFASRTIFNGKQQQHMNHKD